MGSFSKAHLWLFFLAISTTWLWIECRPNTNQRPTCKTKACKKSAKVILSNMDKTADPCDDFYQYACGGFLSKNRLSPHQEKISSFTIVDDVIKNQIKKALKKPIDHTDSESLRKCKNFYLACNDEETIEKLGISKVLGDFKELGGWPVIEGDDWKEEEFDWARMTFKLKELGYDTNHFFDISVVPHLPSQLEIRQPRLSVNRIYLVNGTSNPKVRAYGSYVRDMAKLFGAKEERINEELGEVIQFQIQMAKIFPAEEHKAHISTVDNPMSLREVNERFSYFPWLDYINVMFGSNNLLNESEIINVPAPKYLEDLGQLSSKTSKRVLANFMFTKIVLDTVDYLPKHFLKRRDMYLAEVDGFVRSSRDDACIEQVHENFKFVISNLYVKKFFKNATKDEVSAIVNKLFESVRQNIGNSYWMDTETKRNALEKLNAMEITVAYPEEILDDEKIDEYYRDLIVDRSNYLRSVINIKLFNLEKRLIRFPKGDWRNKDSAAFVDAANTLNENSIMIPAGILQGVFFDADRPQYMNFGAIGMIIAHEITHGFDNKGIQFDKNGNEVDWWGPQALEAFNMRSQCMIEQYSNIIVPEVGKNLNGIKSLGENIADNGGLKVAYAAYNEWSKNNGEEPLLPGIDLSPKQLFWVSNANAWCNKMKKNSLEHQLDRDEHTPSKYRVIIPFGNTKDFIKDFQCKEGTKMNPYRKCSVW